MHLKYLIIISFSLLFSNTLSQVHDNSLKYNASMDSLWSSNIFIQSISPDGNWVLFEEAYTDRKPKGYLAHTQSKEKKMDINLTGGYAFSSDSKWLAALSEDTLYLRELLNDRVEKIADIRAFKFSASGKYIVLKDELPEKAGTLQVIDLKNFTKRKLEGVYHYSLNPDLEVMITTHKSTSRHGFLVNKISLSNSEQENIYQTSDDISSLAWSSNGKYFTVVDEHSIHLFDLHGKHSELKITDLRTEISFTALNKHSLRISDNGDLVLFDCDTENEKDNPNVRILDTRDKWIEPKMQIYKQTQLNPIKIAWHPLKETFFPIADIQHPVAKANLANEKALVYDPMTYEPQYSESPYVDLYLKDLKSGDMELVVEKQYSNQRYLSVSPSGRYVSYFKDDQWLVFDSNKKMTFNLTENSSISFVDKNSWEHVDKRPYGNPGWTKDEKFIILYDQYDIWLFEPEKKSSFRLTKGREEKIKYRINWQLNRRTYGISEGLNNLMGLSYDDAPIILDMLGDDLQSGLAVWNGKTNVKTLTYSQTYKDDVLISENKKQLVYSAYKLNLPPAIYSLDLATADTLKIHQSNEGLLTFDLGKYKQIVYQDKYGNNLRGTLVYPSNFTPSKKYPMITYIYEENSVYLNFFNPPSQHSYTGFNILNYVTDGYFILLPDIKYEFGNSAKSALDCVVSAVEKSFDEKSIDKNKVGLIGHSFGGYEATFIATQTDLFSAVVAGAGVTDLVSFYHDFVWSWNDEQSWRMRNQQFRMAGSFYQDKKSYYDNSALYSTANLSTPLFLWTGKKDYNINWYQSVFMYSAMKELEKEGKLIVFENDDHNLMIKENQLLLSSEIHAWFEKYLK